MNHVNGEWAEFLLRIILKINRVNAKVRLMKHIKRITGEFFEYQW